MMDRERIRQVWAGTKRATHAVGEAVTSLLWFAVALLVLTSYKVCFPKWFIYAAGLVVYAGAYWFALRKWDREK